MLDFICPTCGHLGFDEPVCSSCDGPPDEVATRTDLAAPAV